MPSRESIIRTVNRQLEEYRRRLGKESEEYEALTTRLYSLLGEPKYNKRDEPYYTRSAQAKYSSKGLQEAYAAVTGENTASAIEQKYISEIVEFSGITDVTPQNVKRFIRVRNKVYQYYGELYAYIKELYEDKYGFGSWDTSDIRTEYYKRGATNNPLEKDTPFWVEGVLNDLKYNGINMLLFDATEKALNDIIAADNAKKARIREKAAQTRRTGKMKIPKV